MPTPLELIKKKRAEAVSRIIGKGYLSTKRVYVGHGHVRNRRRLQRRDGGIPEGRQPRPDRRVPQSERLPRAAAIWSRPSR